MKQEISKIVYDCDICGCRMDYPTRKAIIYGRVWDFCSHCAIDLDGVFRFLHLKVGMDFNVTWLPEGFEVKEKDER